ncbi:MAG TPA: hypothetical protein VHE83_10185 [Mycobacteriales bacterium]|nr:hypothetical protein [Mycobacteriales bacterium]
MTFVQWLAGAVSLGLLLGAVVAGGRALRRRLLPDVTGAPAALVTWTAGLSSAVAATQLLGVVGLFRRPVIDVVCAAVLIASARARRRRPAPPPRRPARRRPLDLPTVAVTVAVIAVAGLWVSRAVHALRWGVVGPDSLDYELPLALSYMQTHRIGPLHLVTPGSPTAYYPQGEIVEHALGMVLLRRDLLSPLVTLADLALALLAATVAGARFGAARRALLAACVVAALPIVVATNAGAAKDDIATAAWVAASLACLVHAVPRIAGGVVDRRWIVPAGLCMGMAVDVKLTALPAAVAAALALVLVLGRRERAQAVRFVAAMLPVGAFWYVRDLVVVGSPAPSVALGPLPHARFTLVDLEGRSLARALRTTPRDLGDHYVPLLGRVVTTVWPVLAVIVVGGAVLAAADLVRRRRPATALLGAVALVALLGFLVTPVTAGPVGDPSIAVSNTRYATPALLVAVLAAVVVTARNRVASAVLVAGLSALLLAEVFGRWRLTPPDPIGTRWLICAAVVAALAIDVAVLRRAARAFGPVAGPRRLAAVVLAVIVVSAGYPLVRHLARDRYAAGAHERNAWRVLAPTHGLRVAVVGGAQKYPLAGVRLANRVDEIGVRTPHGGFERPTTCTEVATALQRGHYDLLYVELAGDAHLTPADLDGLTTGTALARDGADALYRVRGDVDPGSC